MASDEIDALQLDYELECDSLKELGVLDDEEDVWTRVRDLAKRDLQSEADD